MLDGMIVQHCAERSRFCAVLSAFTFAECHVSNFYTRLQQKIGVVYFPQLIPVGYIGSQHAPFKNKD